MTDPPECLATPRPDEICHEPVYDGPCSCDILHPAASQQVVYTPHFDPPYEPHPGAPAYKCAGHYTETSESSRFLKAAGPLCYREFGELAAWVRSWDGSNERTRIPTRSGGRINARTRHQSRTGHSGRGRLERRNRPSDARAAWNFGIRELTADEQAEMEDYHRRDFQRWAEAEEADDVWRQQRAPERTVQTKPEPEPEAG